MAILPKIDSNSTALAYAREVVGVPGTLPGVAGADAVWYPQEPNEYDDFGGQYTLLARNFINASRQRKKGVITDLEVAGGYNQDLTHFNSQDIIAGFMYAAPREKPNAAVIEVTATGYEVADESIFVAGMLVFASGFALSANNGLKLLTSVDSGSSEARASGLAAEGSPPAGAKIVVVGYQAAAGTLDIVVSGAYATLTSTGGVDFTTLGLIPGEWFYVGGDTAGQFFPTNAANNGFKRAYSIAAGAIVMDRSRLGMIAESDGSSTIRLFFGRVIKNELEDLILKQSFQFERKLGAPDTAQPSKRQAEYITGAFPNEATFTFERADKVNADYSFVAMNKEDRTQTQDVKAGTRAALVEADCYNTSTDFSGLRMAIHSASDESALPLFAYMTDLSLSINNNVVVDGALGILGGFDCTLGTFEVMMEGEAYFSTIEAVAAIRNNADVNAYAILAKENRGFVVDLPLGALGDARAQVALNEPIKLPITMDAATAVKLNPNMDYTLLWVFFDYLPSAAEAINPIV